LNNAVRGNSWDEVEPKAVWEEGVFDGQQPTALETQKKAFGRLGGAPPKKLF
jgi:hypothetical protein